MADFTSLTAAQVIAALQPSKGARLERQVKGLLYKKKSRPASREEQFHLLTALAKDPRLSRFERTYALIGACHKASELCRADRVEALMPDLRAGFDWAQDLPRHSELRKDGTHLRFSLINVLLHGAILLRRDDSRVWADHALAALARINPRQTGHYAFNSTTNIMNTVGVALLLRRDKLTETLPLLSALLYHAMRMKFTHGAIPAFFRIGTPKRLADISPPSNFFKFETSFHKLSMIKSAGQSARGLDDPAHFWALASDCVAQWTPEQKQALLTALSELCPDMAPVLPGAAPRPA